MKKILVAGLVLLTLGTAHAQSTAGAQAATQSTSTALGQNQQQITFTNPGASDTTVHSIPQVYIPSPANSLAQANCMVIPSAGASFMNFGFAGALPVDGEHCDWRQNTALELQTFANYRAFAATPGLDPILVAKAVKEADDALSAAQDMQCLNSDRQRAILERLGKCKNVADLATLDHRFNQPRNYQVDYSGEVK